MVRNLVYNACIPDGGSIGGSRSGFKTRVETGKWTSYRNISILRGRVSSAAVLGDDGK